MTGARSLWLAWYAALSAVGLFFTWVNFYVFYLHHMFIAAAPRLTIYLWFLLWPILLIFALAKLVKHARRSVDSN